MYMYMYIYVYYIYLYIYRIIIVHYFKLEKTNKSTQQRKTKNKQSIDYSIENKFTFITLFEFVILCYELVVCSRDTQSKRVRERKGYVGIYVAFNLGAIIDLCSSTSK